MAQHTQTQAGNERSLILDYLRVLAMAGVLVVHCSQQFSVPPQIYNILRSGAFCVQIFFVISGYLACFYFARPEASIANYYKKRALRILPTYYAAIIAAMIYVEFATTGYDEDTLHLGWLRYFLGLNTILPSSNFSQWNNAFGFWTMSEFILFYAIIPILIKFFNSYNKSLLLFLIFLAVAIITNFTIPFIPTNSFAAVERFLLWSPLMQMQHFALGIVIYFAIKENRTKEAAIGLAILAVMMSALSLLILSTPALNIAAAELLAAALAFSSYTGLAILIASKKASGPGASKHHMLRFFSKYSFHIYLTHILALNIASQLASEWCQPASLSFYIVQALATLLAIFLLCTFLEISQRAADSIFSTRKPSR